MNRFGAPVLAPGQSADVMLLLEGTYPFVSGGVSSWVHQIIGGLPQLTFGIVFIGGSPEQYERLRYTLPPNVKHLEEHYLSGSYGAASGAHHPGDAAFHSASMRLHDAFDGPSCASMAEALEEVVIALLAHPDDRERDFLYGERSWRHICSRYEARSSDRSFLEYFWTVRSMHAPLFQMARAAKGVPAATLFHVVSTGYAGFLGTLLARARKRALVLTEHGIYTKERRIELLQADWVAEPSERRFAVEESFPGPIRRLWIGLFETLGRLTYASARPIVSLYEGNRERQIRDGADAERTLVVPNGIDVERFAAARARRPSSPPPVLALIGRVVPIKDVKTFVRALRIVCGALDGARGVIVGPEDEDRAYAGECRDLVRTLNLQDRVRFLGFREVVDVFAEIGLNVLTSISEAQPLVVLEGFAAGLPCVATDVGCCRDLIEGTTPEDRALGEAGAVVGIADPEATARAALALLADSAQWHGAARAGVARVERFYRQRTMIDRYRGIYAGAAGEAAAAGT